MLKDPRFTTINVDVTKLHLSLRPSQRGGPFERGSISVLIDKIKQGFTRGRYHCPKCDACRGSRSNTDAASQDKCRIQDRSDRARQWSAIDRRNRRSNAPATTDKSSPVSLDLHFADGLTVQHGKLCRPYFRLVR